MGKSVATAEQLVRREHNMALFAAVWMVGFLDVAYDRSDHIVYQDVLGNPGECFAVRFRIGSWPYPARCRLFLPIDSGSLALLFQGLALVLARSLGTDSSAAVSLVSETFCCPGGMAAPISIGESKVNLCLSVHNSMQSTFCLVSLLGQTFWILHIFML